MMDTEKLLPKRAVTYAHDIGVRALDRLAETVESRPAEGEGEDAGDRSSIATLAAQWRAMPIEEKEDFVERLLAAVIEVAAVAAAVPMGLKLGKRAAKATGKVIRKKTKTLRKAAKKTMKAVVAE